MAKFCGKCGSRLDEATGLCPICSKVNTALNEAVWENTDDTADERTVTRKSTRRILLFFILGVFLVGILGVTAYFHVRFGESAQQSASVDTSIIQANVVQYANDDFIYSPPEESILFDETECVVFYDDVLIAYLESEVSDEEAADIASTVCLSHIDMSRSPF